jgi:hypothetical protein
MKRLSNSKEYLSTSALAKRWEMSEGTIKNWRTRKRGPSYYKDGKAVYYKLSDIVAFESKTKPKKIILD